MNHDRRIARLILAALLGFILAAALTTVAEGHERLDRLTNRYRVAHDLHRLKYSARLHYLARKRAREIVTNFSHQYWWINRSRCTRAWGENIMYRIPAPEHRALYAFRAFRDSPPHRANMLGRYTHRGSAIYVAPNGGMYVVQLFGRRCATS